MDDQPGSEEKLDLREMLGWVEFCAWSALVMTPIIWWLQGPSVSTDQFVMRTGLVVISAMTGIGLRIQATIAHGHHLRSPTGEVSPSGGRAEPKA